MPISFQNNLSEIPTTLKSHHGLHEAHSPSSLGFQGLEHFQDKLPEDEACLGPDALDCLPQDGPVVVAAGSPEVGVMGAAAKPFMLRAAICCIWAAAKAAMGFR